MAHVLDRPVWASLSGHHAALGLGDPLTKRYQPNISPFASARDDGKAAAAALASLVAASGPAYVLQATPIVVPDGIDAGEGACCLQFVAERQLAAPTTVNDIVPLGAADAAEMLALARLTEPGPFAIDTWRMGRFVGIRDGGRLVAMAGERFHPPGFTEISGVCTHPDVRGRGYARRLSRWVGSAIAARGESAFLHAWQHNAAAIGLYESLGFRLRTTIHVAALSSARQADATHE